MFDPNKIFSIGDKVRWNSENPPHHYYNGKIIGFFTESTDRVCAIVEFDRGYFILNGDFYLTKMLVHINNLEHY